MKKTMVMLSVAALSLSPLGLAADGAAAAPPGGAGGGRGARGAGGPGAQLQERLKEAWAAVDKQACFKAMDTDADGNVSSEEFEKADLQAVFGGALREAMLKRGGMGPGAGAHDAAGGPAQWDKNGDGKITADEFPRGEEAFKKLLERADKDGDGALSTDEMKAAREGMQQRQQRHERQGQKP